MCVWRGPGIDSGALATYVLRSPGQVFPMALDDGAVRTVSDRCRNQTSQQAPVALNSFALCSTGHLRRRQLPEAGSQPVASRFLSGMSARPVATPKHVLAQGSLRYSLSRLRISSCPVIEQGGESWYGPRRQTQGESPTRS
jgi:hypothetical protein